MNFITIYVNNSNSTHIIHLETYITWNNNLGF